MQADHERARAAYTAQDYEQLLSIALQTITDRDQLQMRLDRVKAVLTDVATHLEASPQERKERRTGSHHKL